MALVAYMLGARVIEKHFTLEPRGEGHRPRVLARCRRGCGSSSATSTACRPRSATASSGRSRARSAPLAKMGKKLVAARRPRRPGTSRRGDLAIKSPADGGLPPYELDDSSAGGSRARSRGRDRHVRRLEPSRACGSRRDVGVTRPALRPRRPGRRRHRRAGPARRGVRGGARRARHARRDLRPRDDAGRTPGVADRSSRDDPRVRRATSPTARRSRRRTSSSRPTGASRTCSSTTPAIDAPPDAPADGGRPVRGRTRSSRSSGSWT